MSEVPATGEVKLSTFRTVFNGTTPVKLSDYFANATAGYTTGVTGIPNSGSLIRFNVFRGKKKGGTGNGLYNFTGHTFTNAGATGRSGPTLSQCKSAYSSATWAQDTAYLNMTTQGIQEWTVPATGSYTLTARGAAGGGNGGGYGAIMTGTFNLTQSTKLKIVVGQRGNLSSGQAGSYNSGGGGGGSFVVTNDNATILVVAGGGGGGNGDYGGSYPNTTRGNPANTATAGSHTNATGGGVNGNGGAGGNTDGPAAGGGGFNTNGGAGDGGSTGGASFLNNCTGGLGGSTNTSYFGGDGGFGCGGGSSTNVLVRGGGGGGYSGGQGGTYENKPESVYSGTSTAGNVGYGGGGGSINNGTNQSNSIANVLDNGYVTITPNFTTSTNSLRTVNLNFYPPSTGARNDMWSGQGDLIMARSLVWAAGGNTSGPLRVYFVHATSDSSWVSDVRSKITTYISNNFPAISLTFYTDSSGAPNISTLTKQSYDVALVSSDSQPGVWGSQLNAFAASKGSIVLTTFCNASMTISGFNYSTCSPIPAPSGNQSLGNQGLNTSSIVSHFITTGLTSFASGSGGYGSLNQSINAGAQTIASYGNGTTLIAIQTF
jgi:hypothetical protein